MLGELRGQPFVIRHEGADATEIKEDERSWQFSSGITIAKNPDARANEACEDYGECSNHRLIICDGMGSYPAGDIASHIGVIETMAGLEDSGGRNEKPPLISAIAARERMVAAIARARQKLIDFVASNRSEYADMGTTLTAVQFFRDTADENRLKMVVGKLGDSPLYRYREGKLEELCDTSVVGKLKHEFGLALDEENDSSVIEASAIRALWENRSQQCAGAATGTALHKLLAEQVETVEE